MKTQLFILFTAAMVLLPLTFFWGCNQSPAPVAPGSASSMTVNLSMQGAHGQLLGATSNLFIYCITGTNGAAPVTGSVGPVPNSQLSGNYSFQINLPSGSYNLVSMQLNDANSNQVLAFGAAPIATSVNAANSSSVTMGPVNGFCYSVNSAPWALTAYGFQNNIVVYCGGSTSSGLDMLCGTTSDNSGYQFQSGGLTPGNTIAYMGNGNIANYLTVPTTSQFAITSSLSKEFVLTGAAPTTPGYPVKVGDVYCVKIVTGGYAWVQITSAGSVASSTAPTFIFRPNTKVNYAGYEQSTVDQNGGCGASPTPMPSDYC